MRGLIIKTLKKAPIVSSFIFYIKRSRYDSLFPLFYLLRSWVFLKHFNLLKTIRINFELFDRKTALRFPIFIFGKCVFQYTKKCKIVLLGRTYSGMVRIGANWDAFSCEGRGTLLRFIEGEIRFKEAFITNADCTIEVTCGAIVEFGRATMLGYGCRVRAMEKSLIIGDFVRITNESQIYNTNFHYMLDESGPTPRVASRSRPVKIGNYCWIGNRTSIMPGAVLPDWTIVASNSLVNKPFESENGIPIILAGMPAKKVGEGKRRIYSGCVQKKLSDWFRLNSNGLFCDDLNLIYDSPEDEAQAYLNAAPAF